MSRVGRGNLKAQHQRREQRKRALRILFEGGRYVPGTAPTELVCPTCGVLFPKWRAGQIFCSRKCNPNKGGNPKAAPGMREIWQKNSSMKRREKERAIMKQFRGGSYIIGSWPQERTCKNPACGCVFPFITSRVPETCSTKCAGEMRRVSDEVKEKTSRVNSARHSAKSRGGFVVEVFDPLEILDRDHWTCWLCLAELSPDDRGTQTALAPEVDHVIPVELGGEHSKKNCRCACRSCNARKGNRLLFDPNADYSGQDLDEVMRAAFEKIPRQRTKLTRQRDLFYGQGRSKAETDGDARASRHGQRDAAESTP